MNNPKISGAIEGKLGIGKRRYGLVRIMARLQETSETIIALQFHSKKNYNLRPQQLTDLRDSYTFLLFAR